MPDIQYGPVATTSPRSLERRHEEPSIYRRIRHPISSTSFGIICVAAAVAVMLCVVLFVHQRPPRELEGVLQPQVLSTACSEGEPIRLWPEGKVPGALGEGAEDTPILRPFLPSAVKSSGPSMLIMPGGGYMKLAEYEGSDYAKWLCGMGVASYVLMYRVGSVGYHHPTMLQDAQRGMRVLRSSLLRDGMGDPHRVGVMGSSAGGHLAASLMAYSEAGDSKEEDAVERAGCKPDLGVLAYPVISMDETITHMGSRKALLGQDPDPSLIDYYSIERHVTPEYPPTFIFHTKDDATVPVANAERMANALKEAKVPYELRLYDSGRHGIGLGNRMDGSQGTFHPWTADLVTWLNKMNFLRP